MLGALYWPSWVTRDGNGRVPYFGRLTRSLNCIEIARGSSSSQSTQRIVARQREFYNHPLTPQLAIFPEGTTSNGTAIRTCVQPCVAYCLRLSDSGLLDSQVSQRRLRVGSACVAGRHQVHG